MDLNVAIAGLNKLSQLGTIAILIAVIIAMGLYILSKDKKGSQTDALLVQLNESTSRIAAAFEQNNKVFLWMREEVEYHRNNNDRLQDELGKNITIMSQNIVDIKSAVMSHGNCPYTPKT